MIVWKASDIAKLGFNEPREYTNWLRAGLSDWSRVATMWRAFAPVADRFEATDDVEPQLEKMFRAMVEHDRQLFVEGVSIGFREAEPREAGYELFSSLQRITSLIDRPEPIPAMIDRLCSTDFLRSDENWGQHLFANAFVVLSKVPRLNDARLLTTRLVASKRFLPAYAPFVLASLGQSDPSAIFYEIEQFQTYLPEHRDRAREAMRVTFNAMSNVEFITTVKSPSFSAIMTNTEVAPLAKEAMVEQGQLLQESLQRLAAATLERPASVPDRYVNDAYVKLDASTRRVLKGVRAQNPPTLWVAGSAMGLLMDVAAAVTLRRQKMASG